MGATGWRYCIPYNPNIEKALQKLRQDVFDRSEYETGGLSNDAYHGLTEAFRNPIDAMLPPRPENMSAQAEMAYANMRQTLERMRDSLPEMRPKGNARKPKSIEALLEECAESGTHSILDIDHISNAPEFGALSPVPEDRLVSIFGTTKPTRDMVDPAGNDDLIFDQYALYDRWEGVYLIVYQNGEPSEIYIEGASGD